MAVLAEVLHRNGVNVSEQRFVELVEQALAELGGPAVEDPTAELGVDTAAALEAVGADLSPRGRREPDPRAPAAAAYAVILADGLSVADASIRLGIDGSRVRHRLAKRQLLGLQRQGRWLLPAYQFGPDGRLLPGFERVARALAEAHPVVVARFLATPAAELEADGRSLTPRSWLEGGGDPARVVALAATLDLVA